ncbi:hypothetical protein GOV14_03910 [Candidatus Pacearchaeota archaeon]|nr:hypothetical protein [Candidatus Pacearchaeota archaeon]
MARRGQTNARTQGHHQPYWELIRRIITESDIVLEILDSRLIELSRNEQVEELIEEIGRPVIYVINKSDLVSKEHINKYLAKLEKRENVVFVTTKNMKTVRILLYAIKKLFKKHGKREKEVRGKYDPKPKYREAIGNIVVGVLGYPNVGKSSIINALSYKKKVKVSKKSGTTHGIHWVHATDEIKLIDSPGVIPLKHGDDVRYGLIGAKDTEALKDPEMVASAIINLFLQKDKDILNKFYKIEIESDDVDEVIKKIGDKKAYLLKGGILDEHRVMTQIVRDWQQGNLRF